LEVLFGVGFGGGDTVERFVEDADDVLLETRPPSGECIDRRAGRPRSQNLERFQATSMRGHSLQISGIFAGFQEQLKRGQSTTELLGLWGWPGRRCKARWQRLSDGIDKAGRRGNSGGRFFGGNRGGCGTYGVVGAGLELVGRGKKGNEVTPDARFGFCEPRKLAPHAAVRLGYLAVCSKM
jgi:hypothetical protein